MDINTLHRMSRVDHEQRGHSLRPVPEFGYQFVPNEPSWVARQARKLFTAFRNGLAAFAQHFQKAQAIALIDRDQVTN